jgi:hypothetical protein
MLPAPLAVAALIALAPEGSRGERHELRSPDGLTVVTTPGCG